MNYCHHQLSRFPENLALLTKKKTIVQRKNDSVLCKLSCNVSKVH
jgi:hypothetical protein